MLKWEHVARYSGTPTSMVNNAEDGGDSSNISYCSAMSGSLPVTQSFVIL